MITFLLSKCAPGDPVEDSLPPLEEFKGDPQKYGQLYTEKAKEFGFDKPPFYFSITQRMYPDTLYKILLPAEQETLSRLTHRFGNWEAVYAYSKSVKSFDSKLRSVPDSLAANARITLGRSVRQLMYQTDNLTIQRELKIISDTLKAHPILRTYTSQEAQQLETNYEKMKSGGQTIDRWIPHFKWYGSNNQYHEWISAFIQGDFGKSYRDGRTVMAKIKPAIWWTLVINIVSIFFIFLIAIPIGVKAAQHRGKGFDRYSSLALFILYSLPSFWVATLLVIFFTTPEYGMKLFPSIGLGDLPPSAPLGDRFMEKASHLILPIFCNSFNGLAFISRQMRGGILDVLGQDYIRTAKAKGLKEKMVVWKHAFRNALFPLITLFAVIFPAAVGGSIVIEVIFNIPGMGRLIYNAIFESDWPVVFTIMMLGAVLTLLGNLFADIMYALANPRVKFN